MKLPPVLQNRKQLQVALGIILLLLGIADLTGILSFIPFQGCFAFVAGIWGMILALGLAEKGKYKTVIRHLRKAILLAAAMELTIFQWHSFQLLGGGYPETELDLSQALTANFDSASGQNTGSGSVMLDFSDIDMPVGTIRFDMDIPDSAYKDIAVDATDDTSTAEPRRGIASAQIIKGDARSQSIVCNFSGNVHDICFWYYANEGETVTLHGVTLNSPINVHISAVRLIFMFGLFFCIAMLTRSEWAKRTILQNKRSVHVCAFAWTAVLMLAALFLANLDRYGDPEHSILRDLRSEWGDQVSKELVDAFEEGHTYLKILPPDDPLLALENPYDWSQREGISYDWDHLLVGDKIYSYYGIAPVLVLFLPYHALTGYYFPTVWAVWIFGCIGIFFLTMLYLALMYRFFPQLQTAPMLCGLALMQLISGIWFCFFRPVFYETAQTFGYAFVTAGAYFLISANVIGEGKISYWRLAVSAAALSLGVLSRPTLAVYCVAALLFLWTGFQKQRRTASKKPKAGIVKYLLCALLPYVIFGSVQMIYNYIRFDSFFDFGIQYSLTINDFTKAEFHPYFVWIGLFNYLFTVPSFRTAFPFFDCTAVESFFPQGFYYIATRSAIGLHWKGLPLFSYLKAKTAYRLSECKQKRMYTLLIAAVCIAAPFAIMFSIWESGYGLRYCVDFAWQMLIGALIIAFLIYQKSNAQIQKHLTSLMMLSSVLCFMLTFGQTYLWIKDGLSVDLLSKALRFTRLFEVWR